MSAFGLPTAEALWAKWDLLEAERQPLVFSEVRGEAHDAARLAAIRADQDEIEAELEAMA